jgi:hypothetical protein
MKKGRNVSAFRPLFGSIVPPGASFHIPRAQRITELVRAVFMLEPVCCCCQQPSGRIGIFLARRTQYPPSRIPSVMIFLANAITTGQDRKGLKLVTWVTVPAYGYHAIFRLTA